MENVTTKASCQLRGTDRINSAARSRTTARTAGPYPAAADGGEALKEEVTQGQCLASDDHPNDDHHEGQRRGHAGVGYVAGEFALADADEGAGEQRNGKGPEPGHQRGRHGRQHQVGHRGYLAAARSGRSGSLPYRPAPSPAPS